MHKIDEIFKNYLDNKNSKNALMLTGAWGSGKTYYYKNVLQEIIRERDFLPIYISLNGMKNEDQLRKIILSKMILGNSEKKDESKFGNIISGVKERISRVIGKHSSIDSYLPLIQISDFKLEEVVFCLDDIERINQDFPIENLLGFVNSELVEHNGCKVLFIGNESKNQLNSEYYRTIKEKIIGWTVRYEPDVSESGRSIIKKYFEGGSKENIFKRNEDFIISLLIRYNSRNFRTLFFFLDCLKTISSKFKEKHEIVEKTVINFTFIITKEYKDGHFSLIQRANELPKFITNSYKTSIFNLNELKDEELRYYGEYFNRYKNSWLKRNKIEYEFCKPIFEFITTGFLNESELNEFLDYHADRLESKHWSEQALLIDEFENFSQYSNARFQYIFNEIKQLIIQEQLPFEEFVFASSVFLSLNQQGIIEGEFNELESFAISHIDKFNSTKAFVFDPYSDVYQAGCVRLRRLEENGHNKFHKKVKNIENRFFEGRQKSNKERWLNNWLKESRLENRREFYLIIDEFSPNEIGIFIINNLQNREFIDDICGQFGYGYNFPGVDENYKHHIEKLNQLRKLLHDSIEKEKLVMVDKFWIKYLVNSIEVGIGFLKNPRFIRKHKDNK